MNPEFLQSLTAAIRAMGITSMLSQPWAVYMPSIMEMYLAGSFRQVIVADSGDGMRSTHPNDLQMYEEIGVAIQPVKGVVMPGASRMEEAWDGLFNTDRIHGTVAAVAANPAIHTLVLNMDTPGGSVFGLDAAAKAIASLAKKNVTCLAYVGHLCASAGVYLAAGAESIHAAPGAIVGSIGTIASLTDTSGLFEKMGVKKQVFTADGTLKGMGTPGVAPSAEQIAHMESMVASYSKEFKSWMTKRRGLKPGDMLGQIFEARKAPPGMCDTCCFTSMDQMLAAGLKMPC